MPSSRLSSFCSSPLFVPHRPPKPRNAAIANPTASTPRAAPNWPPSRLPHPSLGLHRTRGILASLHIFAQEDNFYYLTGHNEESAGLIILPPSKSGSTHRIRFERRTLRDIPQEILFLPPKNPAKEKWNGLRLSPTDPGIQARTGFDSVLPYPEMRATLEKLAEILPHDLHDPSVRKRKWRLPARKTGSRLDSHHRSADQAERHSLQHQRTSPDQIARRNCVSHASH